jgi:membrane protein DedA with SNARE-associated domain
MEILYKLLEFLTPYGTYSYFVMLAILLACGFGLPIPEDITLVTGGILAARGICDFWIVLLVGMTGVLAGDSFVFILGRTLGPAVKQRALFKRIVPDRVDERVKGIVQKYGDKVIFMARFMPGLRTPIFLTCGIYHVRFWKFFLLDGTASIISVPVWTFVGYLFGKNLEELEHRIRQFQFGLYALLVVLVVVFVTLTLLKRRALKRVATE